MLFLILDFVHIDVVAVDLLTEVYTHMDLILGLYKLFSIVVTYNLSELRLSIFKYYINVRWTNALFGYGLNIHSKMHGHDYDRKFSANITGNTNINILLQLECLYINIRSSGH